jgi:hypothetical protein
MVAESPEIERKNVFQLWPVNLDGRTLSKLSFGQKSIGSMSFDQKSIG